MIAFIKGTVYGNYSDSIIVENQGIGYRIYVANPMKFQKRQETIVYTYQHVREDAITLFGFSSLEEHDLFLRLISVKGVGPRTALGMLAITSANEMIQAIENNDVKYMKSLPGIGAKTASQIVLDLKGKLVEVETKQDGDMKNEIKEAIEALKGLGYKPSELQSIVKELSQNDAATVEEYIRQALGILAKRKGI
ncbi:MAG: Holliday junction branch migration protein RuvA [Erysipelotrichaceae bacterium]|nr:Holliday junction branch migration protein RuvA [Erysipelotrichaceae bacterium]